MPSDVDQCTLYGHSFVHQPQQHAYICDKCGRMVTQVDLDDIQGLFTSDCEVFGHAWQEYRPAGEALFCTGLSTCRRCGVTRPTDEVLPIATRYFVGPEPPRIGRADPMERNLTEFGFNPLFWGAGRRANASVIRTLFGEELLRGARYPYAFIDEDNAYAAPEAFEQGRGIIDHIARPPVCAPLDHEWVKATPQNGYLEDECRICRRTRKEVEDA